MRTTLVAIGSYGDVLPFVTLGRHLQECGYEVRVATHHNFEDLVTRYGLSFHPLPMDPKSLLTPEQAAAMRRGPLLAARTVQRAFAAWVPELCTAVDMAAEHTDVLVLSALAWPGQHSALARDLPCLSVHLQPLEPTSAWPPVALGTPRLPGRLNRALGHLVRHQMVAPHIKAVNATRRTHGLPPITAPDHLRLDRSNRFPVAGAFSRHVIPRPADWRPSIGIFGYLDAEPPPGWAPPATLSRFLDDGPPPVFIGFGSSAPLPPKTLGRIVRRALDETGLRAVIQPGWANLAVDGDDVLLVEEVPHSWLLPRTRAAVHHAGAGTSGSALRAGVPSVPVPVALDQRFWAQRLHALGAATRPLPVQKLSVDSLAAALKTATREASLTDRARQLQRKLASEHAAAAITAMIAALPSRAHD